MLERYTITLFKKAEINPSTNVMQSEAVLQSSSKHLLCSISECIQATNEAITIRSAFPGQEANAKAVEISRKEINYDVFNKLKDFNANITSNLLVKLLSNAIKTHESGNCYEFSLYCYALLSKQNISSEIFRIKNGNHVFIVINRDPLLPSNDFTCWNKDAIIVDTFLGKVYMAYEIPLYLSSCLYDEVKNEISYVAFNSSSQTLANDVLPELVEDWNRQVIRMK
jgi:hypothetical protein